MDTGLLLYNRTSCKFLADKRLCNGIFYICLDFCILRSLKYSDEFLFGRIYQTFFFRAGVENHQVVFRNEL